MEWLQIISALESTPVPVAFAAMAFVIYKQWNRNNDLVNMLMDVSKESASAMNELARQIENILRGRT